MITHEEIKRVFHYDPEIGKLIWTVATARRISVGDEAGYIGNNGYRYVQVNGEMYLAHYIIWNYQTGEWPPKDKEVDHENRIRSNNCWTNLRLLTPTFNKMNTDVRSHSGTGVKGVHLERGATRRKYRSQISINGKNKIFRMV